MREVPKNNGGVYLFLHFQVFDSFPKPYAQKTILQSLIQYALLYSLREVLKILLRFCIWETPLCDLICAGFFFFRKLLFFFCHERAVLEQCPAISYNCIGSDSTPLLSKVAPIHYITGNLS